MAFGVVLACVLTVDRAVWLVNSDTIRANEVKSIIFIFDLDHVDGLIVPVVPLHSIDGHLHNGNHFFGLPHPALTVFTHEFLIIFTIIVLLHLLIILLFLSLLLVLIVLIVIVVLVLLAFLGTAFEVNFELVVVCAARACCVVLLVLVHLLLLLIINVKQVRALRLLLQTPIVASMMSMSLVQEDRVRDWRTSGTLQWRQLLLINERLGTVSDGAALAKVRLGARIWCLVLNLQVIKAFAVMQSIGIGSSTAALVGRRA